MSFDSNRPRWSSGLQGNHRKAARRSGSTRHKLARRSRLSHYGAEPLEARALLTVGVQISEFMASNDTILTDEDGSYSDWIELHNTAVAPVNLFGWYLTDSPSNLTKWQFPNVTINSDAYMVVFASNKDRRIAGSTLHTNFKLDAEGEYLALVQGDGSTIEYQYSPTYPTQQSDVSYGIGPGQSIDTLVDTGASAKFLVPTAGNPVGDWRTTGFNDSTWANVATGVGYQNIAGGSQVGPVGYWTFDDTPNDASGNGHNAALFGSASYSTDVPSQIGTGKSLSLNGTAGNYAQVNPLDVSESGLAVSFWFKGSSTGRGLFSVAKGNLGASGNDRNIYLLSSNIAAQLKGGVTTEAIASSAQTYSNGAWHHLVYTFEQGIVTQRVYVDGVLRATGSQSSSLITDQDRIYIGFSPPGLVDYWNGQIDDVAIFNASLGPSQVTALFNGANPLELQSYAADIATDVGGSMNGVNATSYLRVPFNVADTGLYDGLKLKVKYDDGFVAYLNGTEIARRNAPAVPAWDSASTGVHLNSLAAQFEDIDVSANVGLLHNGSNVLAIQGLNVSASNGDFLIVPKLIDEDTTGIVQQYYTLPTPGGANNFSGTNFVADPLFSQASSAIASATPISISTSTPGATIRYTTNGSVPTQASTLYTGPINVTATTQIRARAFKDGYQPSPISSQFFTMLAADVLGFSSNLPLILVDTYGGAFNGTTLTPVTAHFLQDPGNRTVLTGRQDVAMRAGMRLRGQSSEGFPKHQYAFETWDESNDDRDYSLLGMPEESDWIIYGPYSEKAEIQNAFTYELSNEIGDYAVRTQYVEMFINTDGMLTNSDYAGLYILMEKIKVDDNRVNIDKIGPNNNSGSELTGGYLFSFDKLDGPLNYITTGRGYQFQMITPDYITKATAQQKSYLQSYLNSLEGALYGANFTDPVAGYAPYLDAQTFINHHLLVELTKNIDGYRISSYYNKDRDGKVKMGPVWDYNLSLSNANYLTGWDPSGWYDPLVGDGSKPYFTRLFQDPNFSQQYIDSYFQYRSDLWTADRLMDKVDDHMEVIYEAALRDHAKWGTLGNYLWPNIYFGTGDSPQNLATNNHPARTFRDEAQVLRQWLQDRFLWMDSQYLAKPALSQNGGAITPGFQLTITGNTAVGTIYYTLDGTDPRMSGGGLSPSATAYTGGPITLNANTKVTVRLKNNTSTASLDDDWSAPATGVFVVDAPDLIVSEIMYNPVDPPPGPYSASDFEYLEVQNVGATPLNLNGYKFTRGVTFTFPSTTLNPGQAGVVVRNSAAFATRYPGVTPLGQFTDSTDLGSGALDNDGERLTLEDTIGVVLFDGRYEDEWEPHTDGQGYSLVTTYESPGGGGLYNVGEASDKWRASRVANGNPGAADTGTQAKSVVINEVNTNGGGDWIELYNSTLSPIDLSGWFLSDDATNLTKYQIAAGTSIAAGAYAVFTEATNFGNAGDPGTHAAFGLSEFGETVFLSSPGSGGQAGGYRAEEDFGAAPVGGTIGRYIKPNGKKDFVLLTSATQAAANSAPLIDSVVISEIMYHPADPVLWLPVPATKDEYIEIHNTSGSPVNLFDPANPANTWHMTDGVQFTFPAGQTLAAGGRALIVPIDPAAFRTKYSIPGAVPIYGPYTGNLDNGGEQVEISRPGVPSGGDVPYIRVDRIQYDDDAPWSKYADGSGSSLARISDTAYGNDVANWTAGHAGGSSGGANTTIDLTAPDEVSNVVATQTGVGTVDPRTNLTWTPSSDAQTGVAYYNVYRKGSATVAGKAQPIFIGTSTTPSFTDNAVFLTPIYFYQVSAVNGDGVEGPRSQLGATRPVAVGDSFVVVEDNTLVTVNAADAPLTLVTAGSVWKYKDDGSNQGTAWRALGFDDGGWASGPAQLGYGDGDEQTVVGFGPNANAKYPTTYFRQTFEASNTIEYSSAKLRIRIDDAVSVYLNGIEVVRQGFNPLGTLGDNSILFNTYSVNVAGDDGGAFNEFTISPAALIDGTNILAVEIHQANGTSSDISFDLSLEATRRRAGLLSNDSDPEGDPLTAVKVTDPTHGQITQFNADGTFTYAPDANYTGSDSFTYKVHDPSFNESLVATVNITVTGTVDPPTANLESYFINEDSLLNVNLTSTTPTVLLPQNSKWDYNDQLQLGESYPADSQGRAWYDPAYDIVSGNAFGDWIDKADAANLGGIYGFDVIDGGPVVTTVNGTSADTVTYLFRNTFTVADPTTVAYLQLRAIIDDGARVFINGKDRGRINLPAGPLTTDTYTGVAGGEAYGTYLIEVSGDLLAGTNSIAIEIHQATNTSSDIGFDAEISSLGRIGLLSNDFDVESHAITTITVVPGSTAAANGALNVSNDGTFTYQPNANAHGVFSFNYTIKTDDNRVSPPATVTITVDPVPDVTVNTLSTGDTSPPLSGTVDDPAAPVTVTVAGHSYAATNNGDGTWTLADDTIAPPLGPGVFDVVARASSVQDLATGSAGGNDGTDATTNELTISGGSLVVGRQIFYNNSGWDGNDATANASDDGAIATDKSALLPGGTATLANYTSFNKGINGIMVDIAGLSGVPTAADFAFKTGNVNATNTWTVLTSAPSVSVRPGAGTSGSTRVTLTWLDGTILKKWLQVTVLGNGNTGLPSNDVFYFGNAVGEAGNSAVDAQVNAADELGARGNPRNIANPAPITFLFDYNRDKQVNAADQLISRGNPTNLASRLLLITPTASAGAPGGAGLAEAALNAAFGDDNLDAVGGAVARRRR